MAGTAGPRDVVTDLGIQTDVDLAKGFAAAKANMGEVSLDAPQMKTGFDGPKTAALFGKDPPKYDGPSTATVGVRG